MSDQKRQLTYFLASPGLISRCQHREGKKRTMKEQTFRLYTNNAQTAKSTWSLNHVTRTRGVQRGAEQGTVPNTIALII